MLASRMGSFEGLRVLDGFAGTGALGLEALSRGAAHAVFVESDATAVKALKANIAAMKAPSPGITEVIASPMEAIGVARLPCDIILLDPPYGSSAGATALVRLAAQGWIAPHAVISVETGRKEALDSDFEVIAVRDHGKARLHLLRAPG